MMNLNERLKTVEAMHRQSMEAKRSREAILDKGNHLEERIFLLLRDQLGVPLKGVNLHGCLQRLRYLIEVLELSPDEVEVVLRRVPQLMLMPTKKHFAPLTRFYNYHGIPSNELGRLTVRCPEFLTVPIERNMELKMAYMMSIGISKMEVIDCIRSQPKNFTVGFEMEFRKKIHFLLDAGLNAEAIKALMQSSGSLLHRPVIGNIISKLRFFESRGIGANAMNSLLSRHPFLYFLELEKTIKPFFEQNSGNRG